MKQIQDLLALLSAVGSGAGASNMGTFTGTTISDNGTTKEVLQEIETAIEGITADGNHEVIVRGNDTQNVEPTAGEIASPLEGDSADIALTNGIIEKWFFTGGSWVLAYTVDNTAELGDVTKLRTLTGTASGDEDLGTFTGATISDSVTIKTALQELETLSEDTEADKDDLRTLSGTADGDINFGTFTGSTISDNTTTKGALQELETQVEAIEAKNKIEDIAAPVTAANTDFSVTITEPRNGLEGINGVSINGISLRASEIKGVSGTTLTLNVEYAVDASDIIVVSLIK